MNQHSDLAGDEPGVAGSGVAVWARDQVTNTDRYVRTVAPLASGIQGFVRTEVGKIVQSQAFADAWVQANRVAHQALVTTLTGQGDGAVTVQGDTVTLNLAPFIETVKARLVEGGFDLAARIP